MFYWNEGYMTLCELPAAHDDRWFALEALVASRVPVGYDKGQEVHGGCLEPGYRLMSMDWIARCPECKRWRLECAEWEEVEGGSLNTYHRFACDACGHEDVDNNADFDY